MFDITLSWGQFSLGRKGKNEGSVACILQEMEHVRTALSQNQANERQKKKKEK